MTQPFTDQTETTREIPGNWFRDHFYPGEWGLKAKANQPEKALVIIGDVDTLAEIEATREMHRIFFRRLRPLDAKYRKAHKTETHPDLVTLLNWILETKA